ncbi:energy-coupling factor transporter transmembrane protein EcfT [Paenibacillus sp. HJL G12]|uniref:Energy-coupling factor transporter transmembrane protein EcfT n=1 Tax=Paenibacillus dendrobii TaxID=2691084 RepID=A0A7X3IHT7_9BACL|nr:energy-coupling factor transporter transmembrane protein EcfT [Paenibacillus dendrobii]MWV42780.1 energy-coupling factor transporter transmembrane protein EcfT [Paenibacillus dendrobii]
MANSILLGQYTETNSILHRLDPRTKLLCFIVLMIGFLMLDKFVSYAVATFFVLGIMRASKVPLRMLGRGLKPMVLILMFTFLYHAISTKGTVIMSWMFIHVTLEGLQNGSRFVLRIILLVLLASILTLTTKPLSLAQGLEKLLSPLSKIHVPVEQFSLMIVITIRFIPTIMHELDRILLTQKARGYDISSVRRSKRMLAYIPILVPLIFTTIKRAEQLSLAIDARAYGDGRRRIVYKQLEWKRLDYFAGGLAILFPVILLVLKIGGI